MEPCYKLSQPIHLRNILHIHISVNISVFPFFSLKDMYNSWDCDALLNYLNNVYFGSLVRTSCESCSFSIIYCSRLAIKAIRGNESAEIHFHKFKLALISTQVSNFSLDKIHGLTSYLHYQKLE